jgi:hypothetical protein
MKQQLIDFIRSCINELEYREPELHNEGLELIDKLKSINLPNGEASNVGKHEQKKKVYLCSCCGETPVDALNGYDTCDACISKI